MGIITTLQSELLTIMNSDLLREYIVSLALFGSVIVVVYAIRYILVNRLKKIAEKTQTDFDDLFLAMFKKIKWPFYITLAAYVGLNIIPFERPTIIDIIVYNAFLIAAIYYSTKMLHELTDYGAQKLITNKTKSQKEFDSAIIHLIANTIKFLITIMAALMVLDNLGYNVSTLLAGVGIGGIAIAFALQNVLSDIFASRSIYFDKPFRAGDLIILGDDCGTVKKTGLKSTRIQTLKGEELVISNQELTNTRIHNHKRMKKRRVLFTLGIVYETPSEMLHRIPKIIAEIIGQVENAKFARAHFREFADFSLNFEVVYYILTRDYDKYMDAQHEINLLIKERFEKENIGLAYPTQTLYLKREVT